MTRSPSVASIDPEHLVAVNSGRAQARTLTEALGIDHSTLLASVVPNAPDSLTAAVAEAQQLGILKRMHAIGTALHETLAGSQLAALSEHPSDTVRGWACFALAADPESARIASVLEYTRPFADDSHFAVREWAWMATRAHLTSDLPESISRLSSWTGDPSERVRRFASEALRPRGVWARRIPELLNDPELGLPLLEPLRADPARYVQDSVANWINDAAKSQPEWALGLARRWRAESPTPETERILTRGLRSLQPGH